MSFLEEAQEAARIDRIVKEEVARLVGEALQRWAATFTVGCAPTVEAARNAILGKSTLTPQQKAEAALLRDAAVIAGRHGNQRLAGSLFSQASLIESGPGIA